MSFTAVADCVCGNGKIIAYASVYGITPYKHYDNSQYVLLQPQLPVTIFDSVILPEDILDSLKP